LWKDLLLTRKNRSKTGILQKACNLKNPRILYGFFGIVVAYLNQI
jgi:hypothetical protein